MDSPSTRRRAPTATSMSSDLSEEPLAEVDEPPDEIKGNFCWSPPNLCSGYMRPAPKVSRRESLLTRAIQSETEHTDHEEPRSVTRALSTQSTWSSVSMPSTAELTSDDGHSVPSTAGSPPPPSSSQANRPFEAINKPVGYPVRIVDQDNVPTTPVKPDAPTDAVEATLGRKRCIAFACKGKQESKHSIPAPQPAPVAATSPPKRKCMLTFACPSKNLATTRSAEKSETKRPISPPPPKRSLSGLLKHRGSDATLTHVSPKATHKSLTTEHDPEDTPQTTTPLRRRYSDESNEDSGAESTRFHEFAVSEGEREDWTQMNTCYRNRLTVSDTLKLEHSLRETCQKAEEEALEEEEGLEDEDSDDRAEAVAGDENDAVDDDDESDDGFHSDNEEGFAESDSESDGDSDFEWWRPGGLSTAATSVDQLDKLAFINSQQAFAGTSVGSTNSSQASPKMTIRKVPPKKERSAALTIDRVGSPGLPDSTDFVCGTLDEDRPLEQAFVNRRKQKLAAKRGFCPQDIDPTFPTSDPEVDEEDDDEDDQPAALDADDDDDFMHGDLDEIHGDGTARRKSSIKMRPTARSPPPLTAARRPSSPQLKQRPTPRSPPPTRRSIARSPPPPRKLFGHSPTRMRSPAPGTRTTSPPNSPVERCAQLSIAPHGLASRPQPTHTSSLPRGGPMKISKLATIPSDDESSNENNAQTEIPKRGAVDIVKGLEKKREFRKRKLAQKMNAKAASKGEKPFKVKPGMGCERMREIGLAIQEYKGKAEHILSL